MGKRIVTVDASGAGPLARARNNHRRAVLTRDAMSFVHGVLVAAGDEKISRLDVIGHGHPGLIYIGGGGQDECPTKCIAVESKSYLLSNINVLRLLENKFEPDGIVRLHACRVAQGIAGELLLWQLADLWKVRVQGALVTQFPDNADHFEGNYYVEATGSGHPIGNMLENHRIR